ncbi:MAG: hypothetical protein JWP03_4491, partial [Phycisphaerales bacterium]|nr:hypothetical protein [Phycisphaerales bacterium]
MVVLLGQIFQIEKVLGSSSRLFHFAQPFERSVTISLSLSA